MKKKKKKCQLVCMLCRFSLDRRPQLVFSCTLSNATAATLSPRNVAETFAAKPVTENWIGTTTPVKNMADAEWALAVAKALRETGQTSAA